MTQDGALPPGTVFGGDFRIVELLAAGGMGSIYVVDQRSTGHQRALKLMLPQLVTDPKLRQRFEREARIGSRIASDHVVQVVGSGIDSPSGTPWIAMELLRGQDLFKRIQSEGPLDTEMMKLVFEQLCHALAAAHAVGIVHRDLKPENIFLSVPQSAGSTCMVKVLDFGVASITTEARMTTTGMMGTPLWMAPEQMEGSREVGPPTDVWALGLIAFQCLTGRNFWRSGENLGGTLTDLMHEVLLEQSPLASARAAEIGTANRLPPGFDDWFARCVARSMGGRFPSATEAYRALAPLLGQPVSLARSLPSAAPHSYGLTAYAQTAASVRAPQPIATSVQPLSAPDPRSQTRVQPSQKKATRFLLPVVIGGALLGLLVAAVVVIALVARERGSSTKSSYETKGVVFDDRERAKRLGTVISFGVDPITSPGQRANAFAIMLLPNAKGLSFRDASRLCASNYGAPCSAQQWDRACRQHPVVGAHPVWTASFKGGAKVIVRGGKGNCESKRAVLSDESWPEGACCHSAPIVRGEPHPAQLTGSMIIRWEMAINSKSVGINYALFAEPVQLFGHTYQSRTEAAAAEQLHWSGDKHSWTMNASCNVEAEGNKAWRATCNRVAFDGKKIVQVETVYVVEDTYVFRSIEDKGRPRPVARR